MTTELTTHKRRKQKPKAGKVLRLSTALVDYLSGFRKPGDSWDKSIRRMLGTDTDPQSPIVRKQAWTLPSKLYLTKGEATGVAIVEAAKDGIPIEEREQPIKVYDI